MKNTGTNNRADEALVAETLEAMRAEAGRRFSLNTVNLAELSCRTGISRAKLRRLKQNGFKVLPHASKGRKAEHTILTGHSGIVREYLCPMRRISFEGFVNYEGRRFGVPYFYTGRVARVMRHGLCLFGGSVQSPCLP